MGQDYEVESNRKVHKIIRERNMKLILIVIFVVSFSSIAAAAERVNGYFRSNGTYVQPYYRSTSDSNAYNNYSTKGNINPYTGKEGTVDPYRVQSNYSTSYHNDFRTYNGDDARDMDDDN